MARVVFFGGFLAARGEPVIKPIDSWRTRPLAAPVKILISLPRCGSLDQCRGRRLKRVNPKTTWRGEMSNYSASASRLIGRRNLLQVAAALTAAGPALMREGHAAARPPVVIDAQVHAYAANTPERPWHNVPNWPAHVTGDEMVAAMDKVGVDGAIYISPFSMYQYDASYAVSVQRAHPDKFALVKPVNPDDPAVADVIADWKKTPGTVGIRIIMTKEFEARAGRSGLRPHPPRGRQKRFPGQRPVLGQCRRGHGADRPPSGRAVHHRPYGHSAAEQAAGALAALG